MFKKILVLAPGHNQLDKRVNSSLKVISNIFDEVAVVYEERFSLSKFNAIESVEYKYINGTSPKFMVLPRIQIYLNYLTSLLREDTLVYIHESGILGLLIAKSIKRKNKNIKIIFDYHDYVPWEIFHQVGKLTKNKFIRKFVASLILWFLKIHLSRKNLFDGLIGISKGQLKSLIQYLSVNNSIPTLYMPNTRIKLDNLDVVQRQRSDQIVFLWVGNIVDGRDLDKTINYLDILSDEYNLNFKFKIAGKVISNKLFKALTTKKYFVYCGEFKNDKDILNNLDADINIGLFLGWEDEFNLGINEIGSPNKVYTYINIGIPCIYHSKLLDVENMIGANSGKAVESFSQFEAAVKILVEKYDAFKKVVVKNREAMIWDDYNAKRLDEYLNELIKGLT